MAPSTQCISYRMINCCSLVFFLVASLCLLLAIWRARNGQYVANVEFSILKLRSLRLGTLFAGLPEDYPAIRFVGFMGEVMAG